MTRGLHRRTLVYMRERAKAIEMASKPWGEGKLAEGRRAITAPPGMRRIFLVKKDFHSKKQR
jgi:hypothetical protein